MSSALRFFAAAVIVLAGFHAGAGGASEKSTQAAGQTISGPIASLDPGEPTHNYPFFSATLDLRKRGFVEQEFVLDGQAARFTFNELDTATVRDKGHAYRTRVIVRRPVDTRRFNGIVLIEWLNVTAGFDIDIDWLQAQDYLTRAGYAWVGVSVQQAGIHGPRGLRVWSPARYSALDVTDGGTVTDDALAYDIFTHAAIAVRKPDVVRLLGPLNARLLIATGHSQSADRLARYYNGIQPLTNAFDGFLIHGGGGRLRTDLHAKAWKLLSETDLGVMKQVASRQPNTASIHTWEVAGASHADSYYADLVEQLQQRDFGAAIRLSCDRPAGSRVPFRYVMYSAYDHLVRWIRDGDPPPVAQRIAITSEGPPVAIARDPWGNALGGIRLAEHAVPTGINSGENSGGPYCNLFGSHQPFDAEQLAKLYPTHDAYVAAVKATTAANLRAGYILAIDAETTIREAQESHVGKRLQ